MKNRKKLLFSLLAVALLAAVLLGGVQIANAAKIQNVFDEIYYSATQNAIFRNTPCSIKNMKVWKTTSEKNAFRHQDGNVSIFVHQNEKELSFAYSIPLHEGAIPANLEIIYQYDTKTRQLHCLNAMVYVPQEHLPEQIVFDDVMLFYVSDGAFVAAVLRENGVTKGQILQYQNVFLNDILLQDWFKENAKTSRFSMENLGVFSIIDDTFSELGEEWSA